MKKVYGAVALVFLCWLAGAECASAQSKSPTALSAQSSLLRFLRTLDRGHSTRYVAAFRDLNGDGSPEAIVYLLGQNWCGSGGCTTLILMQSGGSWRTVTKLTIVQLPIRVLTSTSRGWHDLAVAVQGGGIQPGYDALLQFDGKSYPANPSIPPAKRLRQKSQGEVVIGSSDDALPIAGK